MFSAIQSLAVFIFWLSLTFFLIRKSVHLEKRKNDLLLLTSLVIDDLPKPPPTGPNISPSKPSTSGSFVPSHRHDSKLRSCLRPSKSSSSSASSFESDVIKLARLRANDAKWTNVIRPDTGDQGLVPCWAPPRLDLLQHPKNNNLANSENHAEDRTDHEDRTVEDKTDKSSHNNVFNRIVDWVMLSGKSESLISDSALGERDHIYGRDIHDIPGIAPVPNMYTDDLWAYLHVWKSGGTTMDSICKNRTTRSGTYPFVKYSYNDIGEEQHHQRSLAGTLRSAEVGMSSGNIGKKRTDKMSRSREVVTGEVEGRPRQQTSSRPECSLAHLEEASRLGYKKGWNPLLCPDHKYGQNGVQIFSFVRDPMKHFLSGLKECLHQSPDGLIKEGVVFVKASSLNSSMILKEELEKNSSTTTQQHWRIDEETVRSYLNAMKNYSTKNNENGNEINAIPNRNTYCFRHSLPQVRFLPDPSKIAFIGDLGEMEEFFAWTNLWHRYWLKDHLNFHHYAETLHNPQDPEHAFSSELNTIFKEFGGQGEKKLSEEIRKEICLFVAIDYCFFDFTPPGFCEQEVRLKCDNLCDARRNRTLAS